MRQNKENNARIGNYIQAFCALRGNRAIYFPSYQILETFANLAVPNIKGRKIFIEPRDSSDAGAALSTFLSLPASGESGGPVGGSAVENGVKALIIAVKC